MGGKKNTSIALYLVLNFVFFTLSSARPPPPKPQPMLNLSKASCPRDILKFGECMKVLGGLINETIGTVPVEPCCTLTKGLIDFEAAFCMCTAIKADILWFHIRIPIAITILLNVCSKKVPPQFQCA